LSTIIYSKHILDLADIVKMLNRKTGGSLQDPVNEAQSLVREGI